LVDIRTHPERIVINATYYNKAVDKIQYFRRNYCRNFPQIFSHFVSFFVRHYGIRQDSSFSANTFSFLIGFASVFDTFFNDFFTF